MTKSGAASESKRYEFVAMGVLRLLVDVAQLTAIAVCSALVGMVLALGVGGGGPARATFGAQGYDVMLLDDPTADQVSTYVHAGWEPFQIVPYDARCGSLGCRRMWYLRRPRQAE